MPTYACTGRRHIPGFGTDQETAVIHQPTISINTTEQVLVQAHLIKGLEGLLPLSKESILVGAHAVKSKSMVSGAEPDSNSPICAPWIFTYYSCILASYALAS